MYSKKFVFFFLILAVSSLVYTQNATIRGFVYEKETGEPVIFTNVYLLGTSYGSSTDVNGYFTIAQIPTGDYTLMVTYLGFDSISENITLSAGQIINKRLYLEKSLRHLKTVYISAERQEAFTETQTSVVKITPKQISRIPSVGGTPDLAQYLQVLPGVIFSGDQGGQLYIRGGPPIQNKVLLDGMIIYNPFHSIGLFSVFETDIIRNVNIYTGGFGAEYGGRISSVMDIRTRDGNKNRLSGSVGATTFGSRLILEGPLKKMNIETGTSSSFLFAAKNSYLAESSKLFYNYIDTNGLPFNFMDFYGKISFSADNGSKFNLFGFNFNDDVFYRQIADFQWDNKGIGSNFILIPGNSPTMVEGNLAYSQYIITLDDGQGNPKSSEINGFNLGFQFNYYLAKHDIKYGIEMLGFKTGFEFVNNAGHTITQNENTTEAAVFVKDKITYNKLILEPSFRVHYYASLGDISFEPRFAFKYILTDKIRLKGAGGLYSQNLIAARSDRDVVNLFYGFLSGPDNLQDKFDGNDVTHKLQKSRHAIIGIEYDPIPKMTVNVEGYYIYFPQLTNLNRNKIFEDNDEYADKADNLKKDFILERGESYGIDISAKYDERHFYIWAVYSLGFINRYDGIAEYAPHFDRRHNVNFTGTYLFGTKKNFEFSIRWNLGSGFPFRSNKGIYPQISFEDGLDTDYTSVNEDIGILYSDINDKRLPPYHRLDVNLKYIANFTETMNLELNLGVTNLYNRGNIFYVDRITKERINQLPVMPSFGASLNF